MAATVGLASGGKVTWGVGGTRVGVAAPVEAVVAAGVVPGRATVAVGATTVGERVAGTVASPQAASNNPVNNNSETRLKMRRVCNKFELPNTLIIPSIILLLPPYYSSYTCSKRDSNEVAGLRFDKSEVFPEAGLLKFTATVPNVLTNFGIMNIGICNDKICF